MAGIDDSIETEQGQQNRVPLMPSSVADLEPAYLDSVRDGSGYSIVASETVPIELQTPQGPRRAHLATAMTINDTPILGLAVEIQRRVGRENQTFYTMAEGLRVYLNAENETQRREVAAELAEMIDDDVRFSGFYVNSHSIDGASIERALRRLSLPMPDDLPYQVSMPSLYEYYGVADVSKQRDFTVEETASVMLDHDGSMAVTPGVLGLGTDNDGQLVVGIVEGVRGIDARFAQDVEPVVLNSPEGENVLQALAGASESASFDTGRDEYEPYTARISASDMIAAGDCLAAGNSPASDRLSDLVDDVHQDRRWTRAHGYAEENSVSVSQAYHELFPEDSSFDRHFRSADQTHRSRVVLEDFEELGRVKHDVPTSSLVSEDFDDHSSAAEADYANWQGEPETVESDQAVPHQYDERIEALTKDLDLLDHTIEQWNPHNLVQAAKIERFTIASKAQRNALDTEQMIFDNGEAPNAARLEDVAQKVDAMLIRSGARKSTQPGLSQASQDYLRGREAQQTSPGSKGAGAEMGD